MTDKPKKKPRRPRILKAKPLLLAIGAAAIIAGCDDDTTGTPAADMTQSTHDMSIPGHPDFGLPTD
jgi:hypothetical protein